MNKSVLSIVALFSAISLNSCKEDEQVYIDWSITTPAPEEFNILNAHGFHPELIINTSAKSGSVTLESSNARDVCIEYTADRYVSSEMGYTISKTGDNTLLIEFEAIDNLTETLNETMLLTAKIGSKTVGCPTLITRSPEEPI